MHSLLRRQPFVCRCCLLCNLWSSHGCSIFVCRVNFAQTPVRAQLCGVASSWAYALDAFHIALHLLLQQRPCFNTTECCWVHSSPSQPSVIHHQLEASISATLSTALGDDEHNDEKHNDDEYMWKSTGTQLDVSNNEKRMKEDDGRVKRELEVERSTPSLEAAKKRQMSTHKIWNVLHSFPDLGYKNGNSIAPSPSSIWSFRDLFQACTLESPLLMWCVHHLLRPVIVRASWDVMHRLCRDTACWIGVLLMLLLLQRRHKCSHATKVVNVRCHAIGWLST